MVDLYLSLLSMLCRVKPSSMWPPRKQIGTCGGTWRSNWHRWIGGHNEPWCKSSENRPRKHNRHRKHSETIFNGRQDRVPKSERLAFCSPLDKGTFDCSEPIERKRN